jgi:GNAT superfamily N-acetyltransferase/GTPase SAR1 family protein
MKMPVIEVTRSQPVVRTPRVMQLEGLFDLVPAARSESRRTCHLPIEDEPWSIGLIVGPSGCGKSSLARELFGDQLVETWPWPDDLSVVDGFPGELGIREITGLLSSVGFSSPPAWLRPWRTLSNGERFRADLARALAEAMIRRPNGEPLGGLTPPARRDIAANVLNDGLGGLAPRVRRELAGDSAASTGSGRGMEGTTTDPQRTSEEEPPLAVVDEFTSVVDRTVARVGAHAVAKAVRRLGIRFVAVSCHDDIIDWLQPDWVYEPAGDRFTRRSLQRRPAIRLEISRAGADVWPLFRGHHYLSADLNRSAARFVARVEGRPAAFTAVLPFPHPTRPGWREHRTVCLPDFQGAGIGNALSEFVASLYRATGRPYRSVTSSPAMIAHRARSPSWRMTRAPSLGGRPRDPKLARSAADRRLTASFEYVGPTRQAEAIALGVHPGRCRP